MQRAKVHRQRGRPNEQLVGLFFSSILVDNQLQNEHKHTHTHRIQRTSYLRFYFLALFQRHFHSTIHVYFSVLFNSRMVLIEAQQNLLIHLIIRFDWSERMGMRRVDLKE